MPASGRRPHDGSGTSRSAVSRWRSRTARLVAAAKAAHRRAETRCPVVTHLAERLVSVNIFDTATRLAAQCFLTAVPLLFVFAAYAPPVVRDQLLHSLRSAFGLSGPVDTGVQQLMQPPNEDLRQTTGVIGGLMALISATAVSRAVQRLCGRAWQIPRGGTRIAPWRWVAWLVLWIGALLLEGTLHNGFGLGVWLGVPVTLVCQTGLWWWTQHLLLGGRIGWRPLLPGALITAAALTALSAAAQLYLPRALDRTVAEYGSLGSVFVLLSWLIVVCLTATVSVSAGAVLAQEPFLAGRLGSPAPRRDPEAPPS